MNYSQTLAETISQVLGESPFGIERTPEQVLESLEVPRNREMGDLAFPCFTLSKELRKSPNTIAADLLPVVRDRVKSAEFDRIEAAGPYLNFGIAAADMSSQLIPQIEDGTFLARREPKNERVMIEYSQPNTHKAFHVGHTRNVALGDALVRICEWVGYDVVAANYIGDEGAHIAKCLWYYRNHFKGEVPETSRGEFLGELYSSATELLDFELLTQSPHPNVVTAVVKDIQPVTNPAADSGKDGEDKPSDKPQAVVVIDSGTSIETVVCGGIGYSVGDIVPYAKPGARIKGRLVEKAVKGGIESNGMICSKSEISLGEDEQTIHAFPEGTEIGVEIAELLRIPNALPDDVSIVEEMEKREQGVSEVLKELESGHPETTQVWQDTRKWSLDEFNEIYAWLDARFDHFFYESEVGESSKQIVNEFLDKGVLVRSQGAVGADLTVHKLPFFLLLRSDGTGLYSTKDIALAQVKFKEFGIDRSIYIVDASQSLHFQQVFKTLELMGYEKAKRCFHLAYGMVVLPDGKMSSRKGNVILFSQLREHLISRIREQYLEQHVGDWTEDEIQEAAKRIAIATIKYGMLNQDNNKNIVFDLEAWTSRTGNTGPYLLYAYARTKSIVTELAELAKAKAEGADAVDAELDAAADWSLLTHETESELLRQMARFPEVAVDAAETCQPQFVCIYLYDFSKALNRFYVNCHVKNAETPELRLVRGFLVSAASSVLQKGLELLGIKTVEKM
jgi:arginyl-tRNA synthetase